MTMRVSGRVMDPNGEFLIAARSALPQLIEDLEAMRDALEWTVLALGATPWVDDRRHSVAHPEAVSAQTYEWAVKWLAQYESARGLVARVGSESPDK